MGRTPPRERLASLLKQSSSIPEVRAFRQQVRDVYSMGGPLAVDSWIEARRELGLLVHPNVLKSADDLQGAIGSVIDEATKPASPASPAGLTWEQRMELINARETKRRESLPPTGYRPPPHRKPKPQPKPRAQRQRPLPLPTNSSDPKPLSLLQRMARAWDRLSPSNRHE